MKLIALGTNGWFPSFNRQTMSFLIYDKQKCIILDGGTGLFRLFQGKLNQLVNRFEEIDLFFSHFHLDHLAGFQYLHQVLKIKSMNIYGPAKSINKVSPTEAIDSYVNDPFYPLKTNQWPFKINFFELTQGEYQTKYYRLKIRKQNHRFASLAFAFDFGLSYVTDSDCSQETIKLVKNSKLLLHEHWLSGKKLLSKKGVNLSDFFLAHHTSSAGAALIAKKAGVKSLFLIHHYPFYSNKELKSNEKTAKNIFKQSELLFDKQMLLF